MQTLLALAVFAVAFAGLAIGVILTGKRGELKGSCGGVGANPDCCMTCPEKTHCDTARELLEDNPELADELAALQRDERDHPLLAQAE